jgi:hypothetical protein
MESRLVVLPRLRLLSYAGRSRPVRSPAIPPGRLRLPNWSVDDRVVRLAFGCSSLFTKRHLVMKSSNHAQQAGQREGVAAVVLVGIVADAAIAAGITDDELLDVGLEQLAQQRL